MEVASVRLELLHSGASQSEAREGAAGGGEHEGRREREWEGGGPPRVEGSVGRAEGSVGRAVALWDSAAAGDGGGGERGEGLAGRLLVRLRVHYHHHHHHPHTHIHARVIRLLPS